MWEKKETLDYQRVGANPAAREQRSAAVAKLGYAALDSDTFAF